MYKLIAIFLTASIPFVSTAQTFTTLHTFNETDGASPRGSLVQGIDGNFYGITEQGGAYNGCGSSFGCGTVFKMSPSGAITTLHSFCPETNCADGYFPLAGLVQGNNGNFYGSTSSGGSNGTNCSYSCGTVFEITANGVLTTLYTFCSQAECADGDSPRAPLVQASDGNFYGTTYGGGANAVGTLFRMTSTGKVKTIYSFCTQRVKGACIDGDFPSGGVVQGTNGRLYGTTDGGGEGKCNGTAFDMTLNGKLPAFSCFLPSHGSEPFGGVFESNSGAFYGTAIGNGPNKGGTIFKLKGAGTLIRLYSFCSQGNCTDGENPRAGVIQASDGNFYGTTSAGGMSNDGIVFRLNQNNTLVVLHSFVGSDGSYSLSRLLQAHNGTLYGTTYIGGNSSCSCGTVFKLTLN